MSRLRRLTLALVLNIALVGALVVVGSHAHSLGDLAAGGDYFADAIGIAVAMSAYPLSRRYPRIHLLTAVINAGWLIVLSVAVSLAAIIRLTSGVHEVHGAPVIVVSGVAFVAMIVTALVLRVDADDDAIDDDEILSSRAVVLDAFADAAAAAGVALAGVVIVVVHGLYWLDAGVALAIAVVVALHAGRLLHDIGRARR